MSTLWLTKKLDKVRQPLDYKRSKLTLLVLTLIGISVSVFLWCKVPTATPLERIPINLDLRDSLDEPLPIYKMQSSLVRLYKADMLDTAFGVKQGISSIAISSKFDLDKPYNNGSLDYKFSERIAKANKISVDDYIANRMKLFPKDTTQQYEGAIKDKCWVVRVPDTSQFEKNTYLVAALPALTKKELLDKKEPLVDASVIARATEKLMYAAESEQNIALPIFGTGAAGLSFSQAIPALFKGMNKAIFNNCAPDTINVILWPGPVWNKCYPKKNWPKTPDDSSTVGKAKKDTIEANKKYRKDSTDYSDFLIESRNFKYVGRIIDQHLNEVVMNNPRYEVWSHGSIHRWLWQITLLLCVITVAALFHLRFRPRDRLTVGMILSAIVLSVGILTGFNLGREFVLDYPPSFLTFGMFSLITFIVSFWKWSEFGKPPKEGRS